MAWQQYCLLYRLESPLHIGQRKIGNLMQTRPYAPSKVLWAALTAQLTQLHGLGHNGRAYQEIGELVKQSFRMGYLWTARADDSANPQVKLPWENNLEQRLFGSYVSTALDYDQECALEGSLHEIEFLSPVMEGGIPVYLLGDLWVKDGLPQKLAIWQDALRVLNLGAERAYGWGQVRLVEGYPRPVSTETGCDPENIPGGEGPILAHVLANTQAVKYLRGALEPFGGWETQESGVLKMGNMQMAFAPPVTVRPGNTRPLFSIRPDGLWQVIGEV